MTLRAKTATGFKTSFSAVAPQVILYRLVHRREQTKVVVSCSGWEVGPEGIIDSSPGARRLGELFRCAGGWLRLIPVPALRKSEE